MFVCINLLYFKDVLHFWAQLEESMLFRWNMLILEDGESF